MKTTVSLEQMKFIVGVVKNVKDVKETNHLGRIADKFNLNEHELNTTKRILFPTKGQFQRSVLYRLKFSKYSSKPQ